MPYTFPINKFLFLFCYLLPVFSFCQIEHPRISPQATLVQKIGLSEITIVYSRPSMQGRKIFGHLVPYGRIWRVGANESTKITFYDTVCIQGTSVPPGSYALYAFPEADQWVIVFHKNISHWGDGRMNYRPEEDQFRFSVKPKILQSPVETFVINFDCITHSSAELYWDWEQTRISFLVEVDTHRKMMKEIAEKIETNPTSETFYEAARYFVEQGVQLPLAREYLVKAEEKAKDKYYIHRVRSLAEAALGNFEEAVRHALISKNLAEKEGKDEFVRMNEMNIEFWKTKFK